MSINAYLAVGLGSAIGSVLRYSVSLASMAMLGTHFPWGTLLVNVLGSCLIGWLAATASRAPHGKLARWQPLLVAGQYGAGAAVRHRQPAPLCILRLDGRAFGLFTPTSGLTF
jgi:fluoride ion exporter CrcB/FEX